VVDDDQDQIFNILDDMNEIDAVNGRDEEEEDQRDEREIAVAGPKGKGKRRGKLI
jgi:hypothetical protein